MKRKATLTLTTLAIFAISASLAVADEIDDSPNTIGKITFFSDEDPVRPLDPNNPDEDVTDPLYKPEGGYKNDGSGSITGLFLDFASDFHFGRAKIEAKNMTYYAQPQAVTVTEGGVKRQETRVNYAQVTDNREVNDGWKLQVRMSDQFKNGKGEVLTGAVLKFDNGKIINSVKTGNDNGPTPAISGDITTHNTTLVSAATNEGVGTWLFTFGDDTTKDKSISLYVPQGAANQGVYTTSLIWTLSNTPDEQI